MVSRFMELERKTILVQFISVDPLTFYATSDGTDLVQDILRSKLSRSDKDIFGQEGSLSIDDNGQFLIFEPNDTKNRTLNLPIEHLAYCGALRRMRRDQNDHRNPDQIIKRDFENVDLANRYAHHIIGPPIFVACFHGFDRALCYTFITQNADDACLLVMKLIRTFRQYEQQQLEQQGQQHQGLPLHTSIIDGRSSSSNVITHGNPLHQSSQSLFVDHQQNLSSSTCLQMPPTTTTNMFIQNPSQDDFIQKLLSNPNLQIVNQSYYPPTPIITQHTGSLPIISAPPSSTVYFNFSIKKSINIKYIYSRCAILQIIQQQHLSYVHRKHVALLLLLLCLLLIRLFHRILSFVIHHNVAYRIIHLFV